MHNYRDFFLLALMAIPTCALIYLGFFLLDLGFFNTTLSEYLNAKGPEKRRELLEGRAKEKYEKLCAELRLAFDDFRSSPFYQDFDSRTQARVGIVETKTLAALTTGKGLPNLLLNLPDNSSVAQEQASLLTRRVNKVMMATRWAMTATYRRGLNRENIFVAQ